MIERVILKVIQFNRRLVTSALEHGFTQFAVDTQKTADQIRALGAVTLFSLSNDVKGDHGLGKDLSVQKIASKLDEQHALKTDMDYLLVETEDWRIIPLENLISKFQSRSTKLIAAANSLEDAEVLLTTLEQGVHMVLLTLTPSLDLSRLEKLVGSIPAVPLVPLRVIEVQPVGLGDRACIDTCSVLEPMEGMLIGSQSNGLFLVHNENVESPYADPRPFRVNAGAIHSYIRVPEGKTKYLSEISGGVKVQVVNSKGESREVTVGRAKVERRPLLMITARLVTPQDKGESPKDPRQDEKSGQDYQVVLQNAETIRLVGVDNTLISVAHLKKGDLVLGLVEGGGRHFGEKIKETITER